MSQMSQLSHANGTHITIDNTIVYIDKRLSLWHVWHRKNEFFCHTFIYKTAFIKEVSHVSHVPPFSTISPYPITINTCAINVWQLWQKWHYTRIILYNMCCFYPIWTLFSTFCHDSLTCVELQYFVFFLQTLPFRHKFSQMHKYGCDEFVNPKVWRK